MHIIGTAGHVDHGKSALVRALTGTDPDRWVEEQLRGMTLDLGFAHLAFDGVDAGIIDVPGHERFLHNMLAGAAGMELLLLVVAANEGVMPQTIEHLQILRYLNVQRTIVVVTKCDLIPEAERNRAANAIGEALRGTIAEGAAVVRVSTVTNDGLTELRDEIARALQALPSRAHEAPVYLPIDRAFTIAGAGTVVTGTLMQGTIGVGDTLVLQPGGKPARVRSLQTFGASLERVSAGARTAINLTGIERDEVARGCALTSRELPAQPALQVRFEPLADAVGLLRRRNPVRVYIGAAEIVGTLVLSDAPSADPIAGEIYLRSPAVAFPGVRFVVRRLSPKTLLGGGTVITSSMEQPDNHSNDHAGVVEAVLRARGHQPMEIAAIALEANLRRDVAQDAADALCARGAAIQIARPTAFMDAGSAESLLIEAIAQLERQHAAEPWAAGMTSIALSRALGVGELLLVRVLAVFAESGRIAAHGGYYATTGHQPSLTQEQRSFFERIAPQVPGEAFVPIEYAAALGAVRESTIPGIAKAFETALVRGGFVRIGEALYRGTQIRGASSALEAFLLEHHRITMAEFRNLLGTSRKYAVPLMEWFDARGITVRSGDYRMLRKRPNDRAGAPAS